MNAGKKKGLGRGLSALFGDAKNQEKQAESNTLNKLSISDLTRNPYQPRQNFSETKLEELANSIKKNGIIQPIAVRPKKSDNGKFEIEHPSGKLKLNFNIVYEKENIKDINVISTRNARLIMSGDVYIKKSLID